MPAATSAPHGRVLAGDHAGGHERAPLLPGELRDGVVVGVLPAPDVVPLVQDRLGVPVAVALHDLARLLRARDQRRRVARVVVPGEEVDRRAVRALVLEEPVAVVHVARERGTADLQLGELPLQVLRRDLEELEELLLRAAPHPGQTRLPPVHVDVRLVPDLPVLDVPLETVRPAPVVVTDDVLADPRPLGEVLGRPHVVALRGVLDALAEAEERLGAGRAHVAQVGVGHGEVVALRVVLVRVEVREHRRDVGHVVAAVHDVLGRVVRARERDARGAVLGEVAVPRVGAAAHGAVVHGVHRLHRTAVGGEVHRHRRRPRLAALARRRELFRRRYACNR